MAENKKSATNTKADDIFMHWGCDVLKNSTKPVPLAWLKTQEFKDFRESMFAAMDKVGVGLAANQIGSDKRIAVVQISPTKNRPGIASVPPTTLVNPKILSKSKELQYGWEACLSCAGPWFFVPRSKWIKVSYVDENGKEFVRKVDSFEAVVFQHEIDHLDGRICGERVLVVKGEVAKGAIIQIDEYRKNPSQIPEGAQHLFKKSKKK